MRRWVVALLVTAGCLAEAEGAGFLTREQRAEDFARFCQFVDEEYAYFDAKAIDWKRVCEFHGPRAASAADRDAYVEVLESALGELYDHHAHLGTNTRRSYRLVPTQADLFAAWTGGTAVIREVRPGSAAEKAGLRAGMEVAAIDGEPTGDAADSIAPKFLSRPDPAARDWALRVALAGRRDRAAIRLSIRAEGMLREIEFAPAFAEHATPLSRRLIGTTGYVRIHNSLGQDALVPAFDEALAAMPQAKSLIIDLRDTPSGGNSSVARGIMGRLVKEPRAYQRHELISEFRANGIRRVWVEYVLPRGTAFAKPVVVLVGRWTGSMGEGLAIGLNATRGAPVLGTPMAHLLGANGEIQLPHSKIVVRVPTEKLFHVDGSPRENFMPCRAVPVVADSRAVDRELEYAIGLASGMDRRKSSRSPCVPPARERGTGGES